MLPPLNFIVKRISAVIPYKSKNHLVPFKRSFIASFITLLVFAINICYNNARAVTQMKRIYKGKSLFEFPSDYTVIDIETNGLVSGVSEIIEVSALKYRSEMLHDSFSTLIKPTERISYFVTQLTGITDDMVENAPDINEVLSKFYSFIDKDILIGHNVHFDVNFLYDNLWLHNGLVLDNSFVDTLRLARKALPFLSNHKQTTVAEYYGIPTDGAHRAMRDCEICNACYLNLKRELIK